LEPYLLLLVCGALVAASILASRLSDRLGVPALIVFLLVGMLAGSDGPGGIHFEDPAAANLLGTLALALILFSGGMDTNWHIVRPILPRGVVLATLGVAVTAGLVGLFAWAALDMSLLTALLIGSIISSTDAAAVFSVLRGRGVGLKGNLKPLLEFESGSNDPMAIFLTVAMTELIMNPEYHWPELLPAFVLDMVGGGLVGLGAGYLAALAFNRIKLDNDGLYPVLSLSLVLLTFGLAEAVQANGFLAVYLCGMVLNASDFANKRAVGRFHDGVAWLMQIAMFVVLGLLVFPSQLPSFVLPATLVTLFLMFVARPLAVAVGLWGSAFSLRERLFVAWTGLRGSVPIVLATFPIMAGFSESHAVFHIVFFIVLASVLIQGTLLMPVARLLKVDDPLASRPAFPFEIEHRGETQGQTREIEILPNMGAVGLSIGDLGIPNDVLILLIGRAGDFVLPRGDTRIEPYDTLLLLGKVAALHTAVRILEKPGSVPLDPGGTDPLEALPYSTDERFLSRQVVVVGYGRVGRRICANLTRHGIPFVVAEQNRAAVEKLRAEGVAAVLGDASSPMVLAQAHVARASMLIIATPDTMKVRQMAENARMLNPDIEILVRSHSEMEASLLEKEQTGTVFLGEIELADSMTRHVLGRFRTRRISTGA
jgi:cell volume regulation protein A